MLRQTETKDDEPATAHDAYGQPIGRPVPDWKARPRPVPRRLEGRTCALVPLDSARHGEALHRAFSEDPDDRHWTYLPYGPFADAADYRAWLESMEGIEDPLFFTILDSRGSRPLGLASFLRIDPTMGSIEVGHLRFSSQLQRTTAATEAMYLMMREAFDGLGYRRYEWKCNSLNQPSLAAARRLGFRFEGTFRNHLVVKGRNRDTSWLSIVDAEWPGVRRALEAWLDPENFDDDGCQRRDLASFMGRVSPA